MHVQDYIGIKYIFFFQEIFTEATLGWDTP